jgi:hypothetical protein
MADVVMPPMVEAPIPNADIHAVLSGCMDVSTYTWITGGSEIL